MDADNDGLQDLFVTNGFPKDVTDRDFGDFRVTASRLKQKNDQRPYLRSKSPILF